MAAKKFATAALLASFAALLVSCGGGGGGDNEDADPQQPDAGINVNSTLSSRAKPWDAAQLSAIREENTSQIVVRGATDAKVGDVILTKKTALKVESVSAPDSFGDVTIKGATPSLEDVFSELDISMKGYKPQTEQFSAGPNVVVSSESDRTRALRAWGQKAVSTEISYTLRKSEGKFIGELVFSWTPLVDFDFSLRKKEASAKVRAPLRVAPSGSIGAAMKRDLGPWTLGTWNIPIAAAGVPPGTVSLMIPVRLAPRISFAEAKARVEFAASLNVGFDMDANASGVAINNASEGFSLKSDGLNIASFQTGVSSSLTLPIRSGLSLTAFFGSAEPIAAVVEVGPSIELTYIKLGQSGSTNTTFDYSCLRGGADWVNSFYLSAHVFGLSRTLVPVKTTIPLKTWSPSAACSVVNVVASPSTIAANSPSEITWEATVPSDGIFDNEPTGTMTFIQLPGLTLCEDVPLDDSGSAKCTKSITTDKDVTVQAKYSGDNTFTGGEGQATVKLGDVIAGFWHGAYTYTKCITPGYYGSGDPCAYVLYQVEGGGFYAGANRLFFRAGSSDSNNIRLEHQFNIAMCSSPPAADIGSVSSWSVPRDLTGIFFSEGFESTVLTFTVKKRSASEISGIFSGQFNYPLAPPPGASTFPKARGTIEGTWTASPRNSSFPKCITNGADYCMSSGIAFNQYSGNAGACGYGDPGSQGRPGEWSHSSGSGSD